MLSLVTVNIFLDSNLLQQKSSASNHLLVNQYLLPSDMNLNLPKYRNLHQALLWPPLSQQLMHPRSFPPSLYKRNHPIPKISYLTREESSPSCVHSTTTTPTLSTLSLWNRNWTLEMIQTDTYELYMNWYYTSFYWLDFAWLRLGS